MHFFAKIVTALPAVAGLASAAVMRRAVSADTMVAGIQDLTERSDAVTPLVAKLSPQDQVPYTANYQAVISSLSDLITATGSDAAQFAETQPFADEAAQQAVCDAFYTFVQVQEKMLNALIGKSYLADTPSGYPLAATLRTLEGADDTMAFSVLDAVPSCVDAATENKNSLDAKLAKAVCAYSPNGEC
ncbi:uvi-1 protein [Diplodia corticola]|uniref:Uvi-1 protein n=1 Tax=Diplodia corticola TaxID=236234 RepID=A0A1J9SG56_9PEZI|nr:uvi-1 protein [Diplodia corticola]OJD38565.1 uvi-1 protein [Diplodia corticola]